VVERYQIDLVAAAQSARASMEAQTERMCASRVPGDTHRNLRVDTDYSGQTFKHILTPLWLLTYQYGKRSFQVVINVTPARLPANIQELGEDHLRGAGALMLIALLVLLFGNR